MFDSFIAGTDCITALEDLRRHPNVRNVTRLPRDWLLYEFHHPLFQDPDFLDERAWREKMENNPTVRQSRIEMLNQERSLLAPWYAKRKKPGDADGFLTSEVSHYRVCTLSRMRWLIFNMAPGWGVATAFQVMMFAANASQSLTVLSQLLQEWIDASSGEIKASANPEPCPDGFILKATSSNSSHWLAALWVLLSDARWKTSITKMTLTLGNV